MSEGDSKEPEVRALSVPPAANVAPPEQLNLPVSGMVETEHIRFKYSFTGPLPPPEYVAEYERLLPGSAERIFQHWEREQTHRHSVEKIEVEDVRAIVQTQNANSRLGLHWTLAPTPAEGCGAAGIES